MTGWWRQNAVALGALALLVPALGATVVWNEWSQSSAGALDAPVVVEPGDDAPYGDALLGPAEAEFIDDPLAPPDAQVLRVRIAVEPGDPGFGCGEPVLRELDGAQREWLADTDELSTDWDPQFPGSCPSDATAPYTLDARWVLPLDATGPFAVDVVSFELAPENLRFVVEP
ncbi:hypothetical protein R8Z57_04745 [Microbacterium sp. M3]|uniref:Uncharacterized protein n=1 Tax=Microbacterium arthrosphaerae TaxID=792652 RepID=A0ABU4GYC1_9MICO|nr:MULTISPECIES: hypothetical protein [Microbacterium]MDW4572083.1 hypothetical protein [Microbacterium arthrosphaerae]MDW7605938.1 hypothetical protein [Microbacterium sp. M3]